MICQLKSCCLPYLNLVIRSTLLVDFYMRIVSNTYRIGCKHIVSLPSMAILNMHKTNAEAFSGRLSRGKNPQAQFKYIMIVIRMLRTRLVNANKCRLISVSQTVVWGPHPWSACVTHINMNIDFPKHLLSC